MLTTACVMNGAGCGARDAAAEQEEVVMETEVAARLSEEVTEAETEVSEDTEAETEVLEDTEAEESGMIAMSAVKYAKSAVNVRSGAGTEYERLGGLKVNQEVAVTGQADNGWYRIAYDGKEGFVSGTYLVDEKVNVKAAAGNKNANVGAVNGGSGEAVPESKSSVSNKEPGQSAPTAESKPSASDTNSGQPAPTPQPSEPKPSAPDTNPGQSVSTSKPSAPDTKPSQSTPAPTPEPDTKPSQSVPTPAPQPAPVPETQPSVPDAGRPGVNEGGGTSQEEWENMGFETFDPSTNPDYGTPGFGVIK